ncbi:hypothetical protein MCHI_001828 [Candidatus Magnetoovum chiemensis]|nr:hypothetical protein MCHI_001828 [Candidatus Magnetoovum chiemensis]
MRGTIVPVHVFHPSEDPIEEIIRNMEVTSDDLSNYMLVFPGKRPSYFLRKALADKLKRKFIPPKIVSMDEFVDYIFEDKLGIYTKKIDKLDAISILYKLHKVKNIAKNEFLTPDAFFPIGIHIFNDLEELCLEDTNIHKIKDIGLFAQEKIPQETLNTLQSLAFFYEEFYKELSEINCSTKALRFSTVIKHIAKADLSNLAKIIIIGFYPYTNSEKSFLNQMLTKENFVCLFQDSEIIRETLNDLEIEINTSQEGRLDKAAPNINYYKSPDTHGQVFALSRILNNILEKEGAIDESTVVVLAGLDTLFPLLNHGLSVLHKKDYNISLGYPLHRTPIYGFFEDLMALITSMDGALYYVPAYLKFLLHPYTRNVYFKDNADVTRIIFHTIEDNLSNKRVKVFINPKEINKDAQLISEIIDNLNQAGISIDSGEILSHLDYIHENTIERYRSFTNTADFSKKTLNILNFIYEKTTASQHPFFYPFYETFNNVLYDLSVSLINDIEFLKPQGYFNFFRNYIRASRTPFEGTSLGGLQVLGFLETRVLRFKRVLILDTNKDTLPDTKKEDTILPFKARKILALPTYKEKEKLLRHYFETLIKGAKEVHLFFVENDNKERSPFIEKLLWEEQKRQSVVNSTENIKTLQYYIELQSAHPLPIDKTSQIVDILRTQIEYSPSAIDTYLSCPLMFYYQYVLRLSKSETVSADIERKDIGTIVHTVLSEFFKNKRDKILQQLDLDENEMERAVSSVFADTYGYDTSTSVYLLKHQIQLRMRELLKNYFTPIIKDNKTKILSIEQTIKTKKNGFNLKGRVDRIEMRNDDIYIIDFKTSATDVNLKINFKNIDLSDRETWQKAINTVQLPFYTMLYGSKYKILPERITSLFLMLGKTSIDKDIEVRLFNDKETFDEYYNMIENVIFSLLKEIVDVRKPFLPTKDVKNICPLCEFKCI